MKTDHVMQQIDAIKDKPEAIIKWCKNEIKEYQKLIKILENRKK